MGTLLPTAPVGLGAHGHGIVSSTLFSLGRVEGLAAIGHGIVSSTLFSLGRVGSVYWITSLDGGFFLHPTIRIGASGLGFSQCPGPAGNLRRIGGPGRHVIAQKVANYLHYSRRPLEFRAQLPIHDGDEENSSQGSQESFNGRIAPSVEAGDLGSSGKQAKIPYGLVTGLASVGFVETAYLTWAKVAGATITCHVGGSCTDVLDSNYATVFGIPLAFVGSVAYGAVGLLGGIRLASSSSDWEEEENWVRWLLLGSTTSMGAASAYFMYILITKLEGAPCAYCVSSAVLSFGLLLSTLRGFTLKDIRTMAGLQLAVGASVVLGLSIAFGDSNAAFARSQDLDLPSVEPEVLTVSSSREISLAKHLQSVGARMYGAFWCSHCFEQKQMFGREAMKYVDYVECYPEGYRKGAQIAKACDTANIQGFPTWIIKGQTLSGEQELVDLAKASGFDTRKLK